MKLFLSVALCVKVEVKVRGDLSDEVKLMGIIARKIAGRNAYFSNPVNDLRFDHAIDKIGKEEIKWAALMFFHEFIQHQLTELFAKGSIVLIVCPSAIVGIEKDHLMAHFNQRLIKVSIPGFIVRNSCVGCCLDGLEDSHYK